MLKLPVTLLLMSIKPYTETFFEVKSSIEASIEVKPSSGVSKLHDNKVNTASIFVTNDRWLARDDMLNWVRRQSIKMGFTLAIERSNLKNSMSMLRCERSGEYKPPKRKVKSKLEDMISMKCGCLFRMRGYLDNKTKEWWLVIFKGRTPTCK